MANVYIYIWHIIKSKDIWEIICNVAVSKRANFSIINKTLVDQDFRNGQFNSQDILTSS